MPSSPSAPALAKPPRIAGLDGFRGIAILLVLANHFLQEIPADHPAVSFLLKFLQGNWGISLFLVLSGFLVTGILVDSRDKPNYLKNFYLGRALRILPLYFAVLLLVFEIIPEFVYPGDRSVRRIMGHEAWMWTLSMNLPMATKEAWLFHGSFLNLTHLWSVSATEQFYLLWPVLILLIPRRHVAYLCILVIAGALATRCLMAAANYAPVALYTFTPCRADTFALGGLVAVLARRPGGLSALATPARLAAATLTAIFAVYAYFNGSVYWHDRNVATLGYTLQAALCAAMIILVATLPDRALLHRLLTSRPLRFFGFYSFGIFVLHQIPFPIPVQQSWRGYFAALTGSTTAGWVLFALTATALSTLAAVASWHLFERHFIVLKDTLKQAPEPVPAKS